MRRIFRSVCILTLMLLQFNGNAFANEMHVVFLNPGSVDDIGVWGMSAKFMQAVADRLGISLEVLYGDRDNIKTVRNAESIVGRDVQPDYVIVVNEKQLCQYFFAEMGKIRSKILIMHNGLTDDQRLQFGNERGKIKNWIGTVTANDYGAARALIQELCRQRGATPKVVGISGIKSNPVTELREAALRKYLANRGALYQIVNADWSAADGKARAEGLLRRYPDLNIIWAANDSMAVGAFEAVKELRREKSVSVGGLGGFPQALERIEKGEMAVSVGCHIPLGAWALILLYDYHNGRDFVSDVGLNYVVDHMAVLNTPRKARQYRELFIEHPERIDFRRFSKVLNPRLKKYNFSYEVVVKSAEEKPLPKAP